MQPRILHLSIPLEAVYHDILAGNKTGFGQTQKTNDGCNISRRADTLGSDTFDKFCLALGNDLVLRNLCYDQPRADGIDQDLCPQYLRQRTGHPHNSCLGGSICES